MKEGYYTMLVGLPLVAGAALLAGLGLCAYDASRPTDGLAAFGAERTFITLDDTRSIAFELVNQDGQAVDSSRYDGTLRLVFFGYTRCPNVCPNTLMKVSTALRQLGPTSREVTAVFITLDPERDTVDRLQAYVEAFDKRITALTDSPERIARAAQAYGVYAWRITRADGHYHIDHSGVLYVQGRDGGLIGMIGHRASVDDIVKVVNRYARREPLQEQG